MSQQDGFLELAQVPSAPFSYGYSLDGKQATVLATGELDMSTAPILRDCIDAVMGQGAEKVDIDLAGISFLDSQGIALLVHAHRDLESNGGALRILHPQVQVLKVMRVSAVDTYLTIVSDLTTESRAPSTTSSEPQSSLSS